MNQKLLYLFLLIIVVFFWGVTFPIMKLSLVYISPGMLLAFRFLLSAAMMVPLIHKNKKLFERKNMIVGLIAGILLFIAYYFQTVGLKYTTASQSGLITGLYVVLLPLISFIYVRIKVKRVDIVSIIIGLIGLILMSSLDFAYRYALGDALTFLCAIFYALQTVYVYKHTKFLDSMVFTFYQLLVVGILSSLFIPFDPTFSGLVHPIVIFTIVFTALFASVFAVIINTKALVYVEPTAAGIIYIGEPVFAVISSIFILREIPSLFIVAGGSIIVIAMFIETLNKYYEGKNSYKVKK